MAIPRINLDWGLIQRLASHADVEAFLAKMPKEHVDTLFSKPRNRLKEALGQEGDDAPAKDIGIEEEAASVECDG
jgi:hypothetical protein